MGVSLERLVARRTMSPANDTEIEAAKREAWQAHGLALIDPAKIPGDWERQTIIGVAEQLYGKRRTA